MPHLLVERLRTVRTSLCLPARKESPAFAYAIEFLDILAGVIFVWGSACFLPHWAKDLHTFLLGCVLFVVGAAIYCFICTFTVVEALEEKGIASFETWENALYLGGSWVFLAGTILYWPKKAHYEYIDDLKEWSLGQYFNWFEPEFEGTLLFMIGSAMFAFAAYCNALSQTRFDEWTSRMLTGITSLYMAGSILFVMGSVAFLPHLGCSEQMVLIGAWMFIVGSAFYLLGGVLSLFRTYIVVSSKSDECCELTNEKLDPKGVTMT
jgi:hypothetical protein